MSSNLWKTLSDFIFTTTPYKSQEEDEDPRLTLQNTQYQNTGSTVSPMTSIQRTATLLSDGPKRTVGFSQDTKPANISPSKLKDGAKLLYDVINAY